MVESWYVWRAGHRYGPYSREEIIYYYQKGNIDDHDYLWFQDLGRWEKAAHIPQLASARPTSMPVSTLAENPPKTGRSRGRNKLRFAALGLIVLLSVIAIALKVTDSSFPFFKSAADAPGINYDVGRYQIKEPDPAYFVATDKWGYLPANQFGIVLQEGMGEAEAESIAGELGAEIVGYIELINMYQFETRAKTEEELARTLAAAVKISGVEIAFPNVLIAASKTIEGTICSLLNDQIYGIGENRRPLEMIGFQDAWDIIIASGVELNRTRVGVIDSAIYTRSAHDFTPELYFPDEQHNYPEGRVRIIPIDRNRDLTDNMFRDSKDQLILGGMGHGTAVTQIIAADPDLGIAGVASQLGEKLEVQVSTSLRGEYELNPDKPPDPNDPVRYEGYHYTHLARMLKQVEKGATVINCSWSLEHPGPEQAASARATARFLRIMNERYPHVIFVAAAGNQRMGLDGSNSLWGRNLPNLITVGALNNDGDRAGAADWHSKEDLERMRQRAIDIGTIDAGMSLKEFIKRLQIGSNFAVEGGELLYPPRGPEYPSASTPRGG